ncbi:MAG: siphovirus ReqiPepy6 Gp37-like family protein, partial [Clostridia bacterium]|nr:siphovirus ReqiPepy6 Gp37-like family protein [Clostridia bacterium]
MEYESGELYIYNRDLTFLGVVDTYSSLRWRRKYFEAGEFEIHLQVTEKNLNMFKKDTIVTRQGSTEAGFVKNIEITEGKDNTELVISGRFLSYFLYRRIVKQKVVFAGKILDGMRKLLKQMRPFKALEIEESDLDSPEVVFQCTYKNVY